MTRIYGPYLYGKTSRSHGRLFVALYDTETKGRRCMSYPRYLMEQHLGRKLEDWEQVDHKNDDYRDNDIGNLQILTKLENIRKSHKSAKMVECVCHQCGIVFSREARQTKGKIRVFCSRSCVGKFVTGFLPHRGAPTGNKNLLGYKHTEDSRKKMKSAWRKRKNPTVV